MKPAVYPITITKGDGWELLITLKESKTGPAIDLTGYIIASDIRRSAADASVSASMAIELMDQSVGSTRGKFVLRLDPAQTASLSGKYVYDVQFTPTSGMPKTYLKGTITFEPDVTR